MGNKKPFAILPECHLRAMEGIIGTLGSKDIPIIGLSHKQDCAAFHSCFVTQKMISPPAVKEKEFIDFLVKNIPRGVLFTSSDHTAVIFSKYREILAQNGFLLNLPNSDSLFTGFDKWLCYSHAKENGIPCAHTKLIINKDSLVNLTHEFKMPFIFKATTLAGGNYYMVDREEDIFDAYEEIRKQTRDPENIHMNPKIMAQQWLSYNMKDIWCVESYYDRKGVSTGFWPIKKWRTVIYKKGTYGSRLYAGESLKEERLEMLSKKLLDSLSWRGFAHMDWVYMTEEDQFYLTEINPRLPGFSAFPSKAGFDMAYYYYADLLGFNFSYNKTGNHIYFELFRYPGDISAALGAISRGQYSWKELFKSYKRALQKNTPVIIDFFDHKDRGMTLYNIKLMFRNFLQRILQKNRNE